MWYKLCKSRGRGLRGRRLSGNGGVAHDGKKGLCCHYSAHAVPDENGVYGWIDSRGGSRGGDLEVDDLVLKPVRSPYSVYASSGRGQCQQGSLSATCGLCSKVRTILETFPHTPRDRPLSRI